jgi:NAD(P)-dependent dehydrogenase (short-subunit alcohol dehydrogenase family)
MAETENRVALITGAARGIGRATAERFFADGWRLALLDFDADNLAEAAARFAAPERVVALPADVSDQAQVATAMAALSAKFGRLDALVNNAGIAIFKAAIETPLEDWMRVLAVNLTGPFIVSMAAVPLLRVGGGSIVNITSISGLRASTMRVAYGTSKAGLAHLTKQLAVELASLGIRVNAVAPGPVETAMAKAVHTPAIRADYRDSVPLARYGLETELAEAIYFLSSSRASYVTGQVLAVDGGFDAAGIGLATFRRDFPSDKI